MNDKLDMAEIKQALAELKEKVNAQAHILGDKMKESAKTGAQKVEHVKSVIEEKPLQAVGIAALAGLIIGCLLSRK